MKWLLSAAFAVCMALLPILPAPSAQAASLSLPSGLKRIETQAFYGDTGLDEVTVPEGAEVIDSLAFARSSVKTVNLPGSLYFIADNAFLGCADLKVNAREGTYAYTWAVRNGYIKIPDVSTDGATEVIVPETLRAGTDLIAQISGPENAIRHIIYIVDEQTGEYQYQELNKVSGKLSFEGWNFTTEHTYRMTVYTVTRQYQTLTPEVKTIRVAGQKPAAPAVELPESLRAGQSFWANKPNSENFVLKCEYYNSAGELFNTETNYGINIDTWQFNDKTPEGTIRAMYTEKKNGLWSEWSQPHIITVTRIGTIVGDVDFPDTVENGTDTEISFSYEGAPDSCYYLFVSEDTQRKEYHGSYGLPGADGQYDLQVLTGLLDPGEYTFKLVFCSDNGNGESTAFRRNFRVAAGTREKAPEVVCENREVYIQDNVNFSILTQDAEAVSVKRTDTRGDLEYYSVSVQGEWTQWSSRCQSDVSEVYTYQFAVQRDGKWSEWSPGIEILFKELSQLETAVIHAPSICTAGEDLVFSFDAVENAESYWASVYFPYTGENLYSWDSEDSVPGEELTVPGYLLAAGQYEIQVYAYASGYYESYSTKKFTVRGNQPIGPDVTVEEPLRIKSTAKFTIHTENAEALQVKYTFYRDGGESRGTYLSIPVTGEETKWRYNIEEYYQGESLTIAFSVKKEGIWSQWTTKTYTIEGLPALDSTVIHLDDTIEAGKDLTFTIDPVVNATRYEISLIQNNRERVNQSWYEGTPVRINGYELEPGIYSVKVYAYSDDYTTSTSEKSFTVTGVKTAGPDASVDTNTVYHRENYTFTIDTAGADALVYKSYRNSNSYDSVNSIPLQGDTTLWTTYSYENATYDLNYVFAVLKNGKWSAWSNPVTVSVHQKPGLNQPAIEASEEIVTGKDASFSFSPVENAEYYEASFRSAYGDNNLLYSWDSSTAKPDTELTVPGYLINSGSYMLVVSAYADGYTTSSATVYVTASGVRPAGPGVSVEEPLRIRSAAVFTVDTENAEELQVKYLYSAPSNWWSEVKNSVPVTGASTIWSHQVDQYKQGTNLTVSFSVKKEGVWSYWTTKNYTIEGLPPLDPAVIHTEDVIEAGRDFSITVDPVPGATYYRYGIYSGNSQIMSSSNLSTIGMLRFNGYDFEPGTYRMTVTAESDEYASSTSEKTFTISGTKNNPPEASVDKSSALTEEYYKFTIDTTDADALMCKERYTYASGNGGSSTRSISVRGDLTEWSSYSYEAAAWQYSFTVLRNGVWSAWSDPVSVSVRRRPELAQPVIQAEGAIRTGEDFTFRFAPVENAATYEASFCSAYGNNETLYSWNSTKALPDTELTVPGYLLSSGSYYIRVKAYAEGYTSSSVTQYVTASGTRPAGPEVSVEEPLRIKNTAVFTVDTEGAEGLQVKYQYSASDNWWSEQKASVSVSGASTEWSLQIPQYQSYEGATLTASFSVKKAGIWSAWKTYTYTIAGLQPLDPPAVHVEETIHGGADVNITVDTVENATYYSYVLYMPDGRSRSGGSSVPIGTLNYPGATLEAGEYRFTVTASSSDYASSESEKTFTVLDDRAEAPEVQVNLTDAKVNQVFTFMIDTEGADQVYCRCNDNSPYTINVLESETQWNESQYSAGTYLYRFAVKKNGVWSAWTDPIAVTVTEYEPLDAPEITVSTPLESGRDLVVTLSTVEEATNYYLYLSKADGTFSQNRSISEGNELSVTFSGYLLTPGEYQIQAYARNSNVSSPNANETVVLISAERPAAPAVTPPDNTTVSWFSYVPFTIENADADLIAVRYFTPGNTNNLNYNTKAIQDGQTETVWSLYIDASARKYSFAVRKDGMWSEWSEFVTVTAQ